MLLSKLNNPTVTLWRRFPTNQPNDERLDSTLMKKSFYYIINVLLLSQFSCSQSPDSSDLPIVDYGTPGIEILSPGENFVVGQALATTDTPPSVETVTVTGLVRLAQSANDPLPQIKVNNQNVTTALVDQSSCPTIDNLTCYAFSTNLSYSKGKHQIDLLVTDVNGVQMTKTLQGAVDYCRIAGKDAGVLAEIQDDVNAPQGNRCHEIDGCSVYITESDPLATSDSRNDPMAGVGNGEAVASTAFGAGTLPISEYFVHGQKPNDALPCNIHDVCYQTTASTKDSCDRTMWASMKDVCAAAYPGNNPHPTGSNAYFKWDTQKAGCYAFADSYYGGVNLGGASTFEQRKLDYQP